MTTYGRDYPRFVTDLLVEVVLRAGNVIHVHGVNVSRAGMQITCDGPTASLLVGEHPERRGIEQRADIRLRIPLGWPERDRVMLDVDCRVVYIRRESENRFSVGLRFKQFAGNGEEVMADYVMWLIAQPERR